MPNGLPGALRSGYEIGRTAGGRSGVGLALSKIADRLRGRRETEEAVGVLGRTERVKERVKAEFAPPREYKPTTREAALEFEGAKAGLRAKPTEWQLQKEAQDEAFRRLGGSYMVGLTEESKEEYERLSDEIYQGLRGQYGYTEAAPRPKKGLGVKEGVGFSKDITATNPATGEKMVFRDGRWQALTR